jgi:hypothetical protein
MKCGGGSFTPFFSAQVTQLPSAEPALFQGLL